MGRHEEVSCQCEVRGWNACAHGQGEKHQRRRCKEERGRDSVTQYVITLYLERHTADVTLETLPTVITATLTKYEYFTTRALLHVSRPGTHIQDIKVAFVSALMQLEQWKDAVNGFGTPVN